jgi:choline kinase
MGLPKALVDLGGRSIIARLLESTSSIPNCRVIVGFREDEVAEQVFQVRPDAVLVRNPAFLTTSTLTSFRLGAEALFGKTIFMDGDLVITQNEFERFAEAAGQSASLFGYCPVSSDDPVYAHVSPRRTIVEFSRSKPSKYEWASVFCAEPGELFGTGEISDHRGGTVFEWISANLPLPGALIHVAEVDTPADLERVRRRVRSKAYAGAKQGAGGVVFAH